MLLRRGLEALSVWLGLAPLNFLVNWGLNPNPPPPGVAPAPSSPPCHHVCRWLSKCHLWSKYHRAVSPGGPLPELGPGHTLPSLTGSPRNRKTNRQPPGRTPLPLCLRRHVLFKNNVCTPFPLQRRRQACRGGSPRSLFEGRARGGPTGPLCPLGSGLHTRQGMAGLAAGSGPELAPILPLAETPCASVLGARWLLQN